MTTFVSVGNAKQHFERLIKAVVAISSSLPQPVVVQHGATSIDAPNCDCRPFVSMAEFEILVSSAELLILHAGAGSVIHAVRAGKLPIVMPRKASLAEHVDDHQIEFAKELEQSGKIVVVREEGELPDAILYVLSQTNKTVSQPIENEMVRLVSQALSRLTNNK